MNCVGGDYWCGTECSILFSVVLMIFTLMLIDCGRVRVWFLCAGMVSVRAEF